MRPSAFVPLVTYPDANTEKIASNAVAIARHLEADLHALAMNVDIPDVASPLSGILLNVPAMIREAEASSRARGLALIAAVKKKAAELDITLTTGELTASLA